MAYSPTSYFFDEKKWLKQVSANDRSYQQAGVVIGNLLREVDEEFQQVLKEHGALSEVEILMYQTIYTVNLFKAIDRGRGPELDKINQIFEVISDGAALLLKSAFSEFSEQKSYAVYDSLLELASKRIYLEEKWKKVENNRLTLEEFSGIFRFVTTDKELDFGEIIAIERFQDHMNQLSVEYGKYNNFSDYRVRAVPSNVIITFHGVHIEFIGSNENINKQSYILMCQTKFYYKQFVDVRFKNYDELFILDLSVFWLVFTNLASTFLNALKLQVDQGIYYAFSKEELINILLRCTDFSRKKSDQIISLFMNSKELINTADLYLKPLYQKDGKIHLCIPTLLTGQFTRVVDFYINNEVGPAVENKKTQNKGRFFELEFARELSYQISRNMVLGDGFCKILKIGLDQEKGKDNEEIDIILRLGETYLIVEAKSFTYRTGSSGFQNNINTINKSKLGRKRQFFIEEYQSFKLRFDPSANFELNSNNVLCCYLSSSPHGVGISVNGFPVVDPSILERYFGNACYVLFDEEKGRKEFCFYKNKNEAERNLNKYLSELPQLSHYKNCFEYAETNFYSFRKDFEVIFDEPYFNFEEARLREELIAAWELADNWHTI